MFDLFTSSDIFFAMLFLWLIGAAGSLILRKNDRSANWWGNSLAILGAVAGLVSSLLVLINDSTFSFNVESTLPLLSVSFNVDKLSGFFIFIISLIALLASIYALGYVKHYYQKYNIGALGFFYNIFLAGMVMVVSAHNSLFFLIVWEVMSLASYFLVIFENKEKNNIKAGSLYFIMTHIGTALITLAFLLLYRTTGSLEFGVIKDTIVAVSPIVRNIIFILALVGFGTKAGIIPIHIWLPSAHPAAPSHVSALMSGVMIKTGIYMFIRLFMDIMPGAPLWWGVVILLLGASSSILGVMYALTEHDIKRLLAYHSIENIGIILLGLGSFLVFWSLGMTPLAIFGLVAALFHTLNHAVFKSLLFMGAGAVINATHTRNMEEYGGLIKYMPQTAFFFLIGSMAISALPPFNGFFSEWMTFQSLFRGIVEVNIFSARWAFILATSALAVTGGLAAMCFVKVFGATFLARPRSEEIHHVKEPGITLRIGMAVLAILALVIGFFAGPVTNMLAGIVSDLGIFSAEPAFHSDALKVGLHDGFAAVSMPLILASLAGILLLTFVTVTFVTRNRKVEIKRTWDCGTTPDSRMEITATGFARSIITVFNGVLKTTRNVSVKVQNKDRRPFEKFKTVEFGIRDIYNTYFYHPVSLLTTKVSEQVKKIQSGNVSMYILYIIIILVVLLLIESF